jgi:serine/threonine-protein kinase
MHSPSLGRGLKLANKFEIVGVLGEGGTGIVYDAVRIVEGDRIALKVIHQHLAGESQIRGRFAREAAILRRLEGAHLCPILDFGELSPTSHSATGLLYLALRRIEGVTLDVLLKREGILPVGRAVAIVLDVCEALREAHEQGVIHRDLKPGNILLEGTDRAVVVDFGMAKIIMGTGTGTTALTQHNMVFGTPEYMAPEQARGDDLDARCDVYATGIILYELLTGEVPFVEGTPLMVLTAHLTIPPRTPRARAPERDISPALEAVVMRAIAKDPAKRYPSAADFANAIRRAIAAPNDVETPGVGLSLDETANSDLAASPSTALEGQPSRGQSNRRASVHSWIIVWLVAGMLGIAIGAWLSMRGC